MSQADIRGLPALLQLSCARAISSVSQVERCTHSKCFKAVLTEKWRQGEHTASHFNLVFSADMVFLFTQVKQICQQGQIN